MGLWVDRSDVGRAERMWSWRGREWPLIPPRGWPLDAPLKRVWYSLVTELAPKGLDTPILTGRLAVSAAWVSISTASQENEVRVNLVREEGREEGGEREGGREGGREGRREGGREWREGGGGE